MRMEEEIRIKPCRFERWEKTRAIGKQRFILFYGVLFWGVLTALLVSSFSLVIGSELFPLGKTALISTLVLPLAGIFWGWMMWNYAESLYRRHLADARAGCERHVPRRT